tara:strand:+ start:82 stop:810 length:729 start_codon:yes stop_codon:yes gene_type:complete
VKDRRQQKRKRKQERAAAEVLFAHAEADNAARVPGAQNGAEAGAETVAQNGADAEGEPGAQNGTEQHGTTLESEKLIWDALPPAGSSPAPGREREVAPAGFQAAEGCPSRVQRLLLRDDDRERVAGAQLWRYAKEEAERASRPLLGLPCPLHEPADVFSTVVRAVHGVTSIAPPADIGIDSDPKDVFAWIVDALDRYGEECKAIGRSEAARDIGRPLPPEVSARLLDTCERMWSALRDADRR